MACKPSHIISVLSNITLSKIYNLFGGGSMQMDIKWPLSLIIESLIPDFTIRSESAKIDLFSKSRLLDLYEMSKMSIQEQQVTEELLIRKFSNNMLNPLQLEILNLHNGCLSWSEHNLAIFEARIKNDDIVKSELNGLLNGLLFYTFLKLRN